MADETSAPKPAAPLTFNQQIAAAHNADAARLDALAASRQSESANDIKMRQAAAAKPAAARPGTPAPNLDSWIRSPEFQKSLSGQQPAAAEIAPASPPGVGDVGAPSADAAAPSEPPSEADLVIPQSAADYTISLPPDLPPDIEVSADITNRIRQFAHASKMNQGTVNRMVNEVIQSDMARIAADKAEFTRSANAVVAATSAARITAVGNFLEQMAPGEAAAALKSSMLKGGKHAVEFLERAMKAMNGGQTRSGPIEMVRGIFFP